MTDAALTFLQEQLKRVDDLLAIMKRNAVANPRPSTFANIRALEKERKKIEAKLGV